MWAAILGALVSIAKWIFGGKAQAEGVAQGRAEQTASDATQAARSEQAVAQSEAKDAGLTVGDVDDRLKTGSF